MAIYAVQGLYAAGCLTMTYNLCRGLNLSFANSEGVAPEEIKNFVEGQAKEMGLKKEIMVIPELKQDTRLYCASYGNTWLPGKVAIEIGYRVTAYDKVIFNKFQVTHHIAHIKANDLLIVPIGVLAASLFTTFVLTVNRDLFTRYLGGLGVGLITAVFLRRRAERSADQEAMEHCTNEVNKDHLDMMKNAKMKGHRPNLLMWIFKPSLDERIEHLHTYLKSQEVCL